MDCLTGGTKPPAGGGDGRALFTMSLYNSETVNSAQFVQLLDLFLADTSDEQLTRQLMIFVCEGFVVSRDERTLRRQKVDCCRKKINVVP